MTVNKRKKNTRQRGSKTHGCGSMKKRRGAGNRGGRGRAGSGKRADTIKPNFWKEKYFGKFGFKHKGIKKKINSISIRDLEEKLDSFLNKKLISKEGDFYIVDMEKLGFNKLLSQGKVINKFKIKVDYASKKAAEKIKNSGGEINLLEIKEEVIKENK
jgi:large subunit ribosomal protein L15